MRPSQLWAAAAVVLAVTLAACSSGSQSPTVPSAGSAPTTTASAGGSSTGAATPLAKAQAYSQCMRGHGLPNWPDPVLTPHGDYGYRTTGIDPQSAAFREAGQACKALAPEGFGGSGQQLSPAQQQAWLNWAKCIRSHGMPGFADPTFSGSEVHISDNGGSGSAQLQSAMNACKSQMPSSGGLGG